MAHQVRQKPIPEYLPELFDALGADVVMLNQFVDASAPAGTGVATSSGMEVGH